MKSSSRHLKIQTKPRLLLKTRREEASPWKSCGVFFFPVSLSTCYLLSLSKWLYLVNPAGQRSPEQKTVVSASKKHRRHLQLIIYVILRGTKETSITAESSDRERLQQIITLHLFASRCCAPRGAGRLSVSWCWEPIRRWAPFKPSHENRRRRLKGRPDYCAAASTSAWSSPPWRSVGGRGSSDRRRSVIAPRLKTSLMLGRSRHLSPSSGSRAQYLRQKENHKTQNWMNSGDFTIKWHRINQAKTLNYRVSMISISHPTPNPLSHPCNPQGQRLNATTRTISFRVIKLPLLPKHSRSKHTDV